MLPASPEIVIQFPSVENPVTTDNKLTLIDFSPFLI